MTVFTTGWQEIGHFSHRVSEFAAIQYKFVCGGIMPYGTDRGKIFGIRQKQKPTSQPNSVAQGDFHLEMATEV